ncbi:MAG: hypothetical protein M3R52_08985, partial [Acidobacteriota bacterium]|nr:hypothetical protein [Acidobacteriota bacterium]
VTKYGCNLMVEINTHPINHDGKTLEIQGVATTPAGLPKDRPWKSRSLIEESQPDEAHEENEVQFLQAYESANSFLLQKNSPRSGGSLFTL